VWRWRWPLLLSATVLLGQLLHRNPLVDVLPGAIPSDARLAYPLLHVLLAPITLPADWLNGGSRHDLCGLLAWAVAGYVLWRLTRRRAGFAREVGAALAFLAAAAGFIALVAYVPRPFPRLLAPPGTIVFDVHSHTARSHDGRPGFGSAANAAWHARAGFDAAFITDHNTNGAARAWRAGAPGRTPRLLDGEELSLNGLHLLVLGAGDSLDNRGWNQSWDSTLALVRHLAGAGPGRDPGAVARPGNPVPVQPAGSRSGEGSPRASARPLLIASLPEFWRHRWGAQVGELVAAGVDGFEVWTSSPKAMEFPPTARATLIARAEASGLPLVGATDMHGLGSSPSVWNVAPLASWSALSDSALTDTLIALVRARRHRVLAVARWFPGARLDYVLAVPVNLALVLRGASRWHGLALLLWTWGGALLFDVRRRRRKGVPAPVAARATAPFGLP
jgi:hypothetical protein